MFGRGYVIDFVMDAEKQRRETMLFRSYIADVLMGILNSQYQKPVLNTRYVDLAIPQKDEPKRDNRSAAEIANDLFKRFTRKGGRTV